MVQISSKKLKAFKALWRRFQYNLIEFCEWLGITPSSDQRKFLLHVQYATLYGDPELPKRVIAKSGQGTGKTMMACVIALWRLLRAAGSFVVITAPTADQCRQVFFGELRRVVAGAPALLGQLLHISATRAHVKGSPYGDTWAIISRTASDPDCLRGLHHPNMTVIAEEMSGIETGILNVMLGTCSQEDNLFLGVFNPSRREGTTYKAFTNPTYKETWQRRITLSRKRLSEENPELCSPANIEALRREWGEDSDYYQVNVEGNFPKAGGDTVLPYDWVRRAAETPAHVAAAINPHIRVFSLDFARYGGDENVLVQRQGNAALRLEGFSMESPLKNVRKAKMLHRELYPEWNFQNTLYVPDSTGMGQPLVDILKEPFDHGIRIQNEDPPTPRVFEWHNHGSPGAHPRKYDNLITRGWFDFRDMLYAQQQGLTEVSIPNDEALIDQLTSMRYEFTTENKIKVWSKDKYKDKLEMDSPDRAETIIMAFCQIHSPTSYEEAYSAPREDYVPLHDMPTPSRQPLLTRKKPEVPVGVRMLML